MIRGLERGQKPALIISECQLNMVDPAVHDRELNRQVQARGILPKIAALAETFRAAGAPVFHCTITPPARYENWPVNCLVFGMVRRAGLLQAGSDAAQISPEVAPRPGDIVCDRRGGLTGFAQTELERTLRSFGVQTVVLTGVSTNVALPGMATEAVNRLFEVVIAEDCTAGATAESHAAQIAVNLPAIAQISKAEDVAAAVSAAAWRPAAA
jgi:nicotinamidase-related amidase